MENKTLGMMISKLRKEKNMTQLDLASKMNVTDKAVSKWERDLSCPDIYSLTTLADIFGISLDELMNCKKSEKNNTKEIVATIFRVMPLAMGVAVTVLSIMKELNIEDAIIMLGIGLVCVGITLLSKN